MKTPAQLSLSHIFATLPSGKQILNDVSMTFSASRTHVIMGPNGSGKSTLAGVLMGNTAYVVKGKILLGNTDIAQIKTQERAKKGIFLAFQSPVAIAGVSVTNLLRAAYQELHPDTAQKKKNLHNPVLGKRWASSTMTIQELLATIKTYAEFLHIDSSLLTRSINEGFSGGERKKIEVLQALVLEPQFAIFDEIDTGLDVDALKIVAGGIEKLRKNGTGCIIITHYQRLLTYLHPDTVTVIKKGTVVQTGDGKLAKIIERLGYGDE
ncbi:MAG: Fe-S cluster assembly ATPase SufC [Microgenomates group bacterium]